MRILALALLFWMSGLSAVYAMALDVSDETIRVSTGFNGASLTVFGTQDKPGAIVIVVEGPAKLMTVRKKERVMGFWTNTDSRKFVNVPAFYEIAASGPPNLIASADILRQRRIGIDNIPILPARGNPTDSGTRAFSDALVKTQLQKNMFVRDVVPLDYPGPMLFKARFNLPTMVPQGQYKVSAYLFQDGVIIDERTIPFEIIPEGLSAKIRSFATENGLLYGLTGLMMALFAGWLATVLLKRE